MRRIATGVLPFSVLLVGGLTGALATIAWRWSYGPPAMQFGAVAHVAPILVDAPRDYVQAFNVTNPTRKTVRVLDVQTNCACRRAALDTYELAPGATTGLRVTTLIGPPTGVRSLSVTLVTDCEVHRLWTFQASIPVFARYAASPGTVSFGIVDAAQRGSYSSQEIVVESYSFKDTDTPLKHKFVGEGGGVLSLALQQWSSTKLPDSPLVRHTGTYLLGLVPAWHEFGQHARDVLFCAAEATAPELRVRCTWTIHSPIDVVPDSGVFFGKVGPGGQHRRTVLLRSRSVPFRIQGPVELPEHISRIEYSSDAARIRSVTLLLDPSRVVAPVATAFTLRVDHPEQRNVSARVTLAW